MSYRLVRLNTPDHKDRKLAFDDMVSIIERGHYRKQSQPPEIPQGTQLIGMGSHGGRGLYIVGVTKSDMWENEADGDIYKYRLPVAWARVVYENRPMLETIKSIPATFNERFGAHLDADEYRRIIKLVLDGNGFDMYDEQAVLIA
jgi:hypothetical protein